MLRAALIALARALSATPVSAGTWDDANAAIQRGDYAEAARLWRPLAEQGDASAQHNLGWMYENGEGVPQDYAEAVKWWRLAAEQGNAHGQNNLGWMYADGRGVLQDFVLAHTWFNLSAALGYVDALGSRAAIERQMGFAQINEAQKIAREWMAKHQAQ